MVLVVQQIVLAVQHVVLVGATCGAGMFDLIVFLYLLMMIM